MLIPDTIPNKEPVIRVGITLPEDDYTSITLVTPADQDYQMESGGRTTMLSRNQQVLIKLHGEQFTIHINEEELRAESEIRIFPVVSRQALAPQEGVTVKNVISGRGFHWRKYINVILPGTVIIEKYRQRLLVINELPLEHYLMCVATSEMGAACPPALIEAQTIAARSWLLANVEQKHRDLGMDVCNDDCCQRYQGTTFLTEQSVQGALNTYGHVLMYENKICDARYSKSCGGVMESFDAIWDGAPVPYLQVVADAAQDPPEWRKPLSEEQNFEYWVNHVPDTFCSPHTIPEDELKKYLGSVDEEGHYFRWEQEIDPQQLAANLQRHFGADIREITDIRIISRGGSGRINHLTIDYIDGQGRKQAFELDSEYKVRQGMHASFLYSSAFTVRTVRDAQDHVEKFILKGAGWGHGVGLCQIGALGMSLKGYSSPEIVSHYYPGSILKKIY